MLPGDVSPERLHQQIADLRDMIVVSDIPIDSLMGRMLASSLESLECSCRQGDWESVQRGLENTKNLMIQWTL